MSWLSLTPDDLRETKVAALVTALRSAALGSGQTDPLPGIIQTVVDRIRAEIAGCKNNQLDADTTKIPASLRHIAHRMIIAAAKGRLELPLKEDERNALRDDTRYLERISTCAIPVENPANPITADVQQPGSITVINSRTRRATSNTMAGL